MKVYLITTGQYSDYHICGVADTEEKAEKMKAYFEKSSWTWSNVWIEEFETDDYQSIFDGKHQYSFRFNQDGKVIYKKEDFELEQCCLLDNEGCVFVEILAKDGDSALDAATKVRDKYLKSGRKSVWYFK